MYFLSTTIDPPPDPPLCFLTSLKEINSIFKICFLFETCIIEQKNISQQGRDDSKKFFSNDQFFKSIASTIYLN